MHWFCCIAYAKRSNGHCKERPCMLPKGLIAKANSNSRC